MKIAAAAASLFSNVGAFVILHIRRLKGVLGSLGGGVGDLSSADTVAVKGCFEWPFQREHCPHAVHPSVPF